MAAGPHTFMTADVFTTEKYQGNPLAIVSVRANALTQAQKQKIAREFNYSETVFIHDAEPGHPRRLDIFTIHQEIPFAGHPTLGAAHFIFSFLEKNRPSDPNARQTSAVLTKAGKINLYYNPLRQVAAAEIPFAFHLHKKTISRDALTAVQAPLKLLERGLAETYPVVSIVKGMTFSLIDLTSNAQLLAILEPANAPETELDPEWAPSLVGSFFYVEMAPEDKAEPIIWKIRARMMSHGTEDPATGSACCALSCHLALKKGGKKKTHVFAIEQGVEMGRRSQLCVEVTLGDTGEEVTMIVLSGRTVFITHGQLFS